MRTQWLFSLILLFAMAPMLIAQDKDKEEKAQEDEQTIAQQFREIKSEHRTMMRNLGKEYRSAADADAREEIMNQRKELESELSSKAMDLAGETEDSDEAIDLLVWVVTNGPEEESAKAKECLVADHFDSEEMGTLATSLGRGMPTPGTYELLSRLVEESPHDSVKAKATMSIVTMLEGMKRMADMPDRAKASMAKSMGEGGEEFIAKWTTEAINEESERLLEVVAENYAEVDAGRGKSYADVAEAKLFSVKYLQIGKVAPDITGEDLDGEEFSLSDYRGKVVVIDFWGDW